MRARKHSMLILVFGSKNNGKSKMYSLEEESRLRAKKMSLVITITLFVSTLFFLIIFSNKRDVVSLIRVTPESPDLVSHLNTGNISFSVDDLPLLMEEEFKRKKVGKHFECPNIKLPDHVEYVVGIGGLPGSGGRTVVSALEEVLGIDFGKITRDYSELTKDNIHFMNGEPHFPHGVMSMLNCPSKHSKLRIKGLSAKNCNWAIGGRMCEVLNIVGLIGTSPDNIREL